MSTFPVAQHVHWRWPAEVPLDGRSCGSVHCGAVMEVPDAVFAALDESDDSRTPDQVYEDVRTFCELLALWLRVDEQRRGADGISPQEAHVAHTRIAFVFQARHPGVRLFSR